MRRLSIAWSQVRILFALTILSMGAPALAKELLITGDPAGADVLVDGRLLGRTPLTTRKAELLPNWATDGRITKATIVIRKAGYKDSRHFIGGMSIPPRIEAKLQLISSPENLENYLKDNPALEEATLADSQALIRTSHDLDSESLALYSQGYLLVGYAGYIAEGIAPEQIRVAAAEMGASLVLVSSRYAGERAGMREVTTRSSGSFAAASVFSPNMIGPTTAFTFAPGQTRTEFVPFSERQFQNQVLFWRKRRPNRLGVFADYLPDSLRRELQRNTGALVVGIETESPAFFGNLLTDDVIVALAGSSISTPADIERVATANSGKEAEVEVIRGRATIRMTVRLRD